MTDDTTRLERIKSRREGLGWNEHLFNVSVEYLCDAMYGNDKWDEEQWRTAAERLLSAYEPGQTVELARYRLSDRFCDDCGLKGSVCKWSVGDEFGDYSPGDDCPAPGKFKLVKVEEVPDDQSTRG